MKNIEKMKKPNDLKLIDKLSKHKAKCKCGHVIIMVDKKVCICFWCGRKVYRSKKDEFEDKIKKLIVK